MPTVIVRAGLDEWYYHWTVGRLCVNYVTSCRWLFVAPLSYIAIAAAYRRAALMRAAVSSENFCWDVPTLLARADEVIE
jgi:hypothetical protein